MTLFSKLIRTKDLRKLQGDDPKSTKPKLTVNSTQLTQFSRVKSQANLILLIPRNA